MTYEFDGETYDPEQDGARLTTQLDRVLYTICDGGWHTLEGIQSSITDEFGKEYSQPGISARLRDLRKERFGSLDVERRRVDGGLWEYRLNV